MIMEGRDSEWTLCGTQVSHTALVCLCQVIILYISIITCFVNLTVGNDPNELWISILSISIGTILPSPKVCKTPCSISSHDSHSTSPTVYSVRESWPRGKKKRAMWTRCKQRTANLPQGPEPWGNYLHHIYFDPRHPASFKGTNKLYHAIKKDG